MSRSIEERREIAREIVRRADTVAILSVDEVKKVHERALAGEFDTIFDAEKETEGHER